MKTSTFLAYAYLICTIVVQIGCGSFEDDSFLKVITENEFQKFIENDTRSVVIFCSSILEECHE